MLMAYSTVLKTCLDKVVPLTRTEVLPLEQLLGRVCAENTLSPINVPQVPMSAMDGVAIYIHQSETLPSSFKIIGRITAGQALKKSLHAPQKYHAWSILTGASVPDNVSYVIPQEDVIFMSEQMFKIDALPVKSHIKAVGSDLKCGDKLINVGHVFTARDIALLASVGIDRVKVVAPLRVCLVYTGDELMIPGQKILPWQTFNANQFGLQASLQSLGIHSVTSVCLPDDLVSLELFFKTRSSDYDLLLTTGSASVGSADYLKQAIELHGSLFSFTLNMKPAKPFNLAVMGNTLLISLPGNPLATLMSFRLLAMPLIKQLQGRLNVIETGQIKPLAEPMRNLSNKLLWIQVIDSVDGIHALNIQSGNASRLQSLVEADGFIALPENSDLQVGDTVRYFVHGD